MPAGAIESWATKLEALARQGMGQPWGYGMPAIARDFLGWRRVHSGVDIGRMNVPAAESRSAAEHDPSHSFAEYSLWGALSHPTRSLPADLADRLSRWARAESADFEALVPRAERSAIEVWTDAGLSALHSVTWIAALDHRPELSVQAERTARWLIEHIQPDNATNHPWAAHLFIVLAERDGNDDARLYAETLIHNCRVSRGVPDPLSAHILADSGAWLREHGNAQRAG